MWFQAKEGHAICVNFGAEAHCSVAVHRGGVSAALDSFPSLRQSDIFPIAPSA